MLQNHVSFVLFTSAGARDISGMNERWWWWNTLSGNCSNVFRFGSFEPNLFDLYLRTISATVAATRKYSCFSRNSFPLKN